MGGMANGGPTDDSSSLEGVDAVMNDTNLTLKDGELTHCGNRRGIVIDCATAEGQSRAREAAGSVDWVLLRFADWSMLPMLRFAD